MSCFSAFLEVLWERELNFARDDPAERREQGWYTASLRKHPAWPMMWYIEGLSVMPPRKWTAKMLRCSAGESSYHLSQVGLWKTLGEGNPMGTTSVNQGSLFTAREANQQGDISKRWSRRTVSMLECWFTSFLFIRHFWSLSPPVVYQVSFRPQIARPWDATSHPAHARVCVCVCVHAPKLPEVDCGIHLLFCLSRAEKTVLVRFLLW